MALPAWLARDSVLRVSVVSRVLAGCGFMASVERTAYPRFRRFMSARELHVFYTPAAEEIAWARENASSDRQERREAPSVASLYRALADTDASQLTGPP
jgi:hypothetical protein